MPGHQERRCHRCHAHLAHDNTTGFCAPCQAVNRDRYAGPLDVPDEFWDAPAIKEAAAARHMGRMIRAYRCHPMHGRNPLSQEIVARWLGLSQGQLSRIEKNPPIVHLDRLIYFARVLNIPSSRLWFRMPEDNHILSNPLPDEGAEPLIFNEFDPALLWAPVDTAEIVNHFTRKDFAVDRREAAHAVAGVVFGSALLEPLERWLALSVEPPPRARPGTVGQQEVAQIELAAQMFRDWDDQFGGGLRRKAVIGQLNEVADLLRDSHPTEIRRRLFGAMAQLAETAALMSWDSGQQVRAQRYYVLALRAAKPAQDTAFAANIMAGMARQLLYLGHTTDALELVRVAQETARRAATPTVLAMLHSREAWAYAKQGRISAFRKATERAEIALSDARPADDPHWISYFDHAELAGTTGGRLLEMAHRDSRLCNETAAQIQAAISKRRPGRLRSSALDQIGLAEVRLIQDELGEAARLGHEAAGIAERTLSDRVRVKFAELYQHSATHEHNPEIASLRDRIRRLIAGSSSDR